MSFNKIQKKRVAQLKRLMDIVSIKLETLPEDIKKWQGKAQAHAEGSEEYRKVVTLSVVPREQYLQICERMDAALQKIQKAVTLKDNVNELEGNIRMPIETLLQQYCDVARKGSTVASQDDMTEYVDIVLEGLGAIQTTLKQQELAVNDKKIGVDEAIGVVKAVHTGVIARVGLKEELYKAQLDSCEVLILQKLAIDIESRQAVRDRTVMYASLQTYISNIEANPLFHELPPNVKYRIREEMGRPMDSILSQQKNEVAMATQELQEFLAPIQGDTTVQVPNSATSVHQLIQQAVEQQQALAQLKMNVMGAFKGLVKEMEALFEYQPFTPVQASSVLGAAWMQSPLTDPDSIDAFKYQLETIKKTDAYKTLTQHFSESTVNASFNYVDKRITDVSRQLEMNAKVDAQMGDVEDIIVENDGDDDFLGLFNMEDICMKRVGLDPLKVRQEVKRRFGYIGTVKGYIYQVTGLIRAHILLAYYEHSLNPESFDLNQRIKALRHQVPKEFYERKRCVASIKPAVFYEAVEQVFDGIGDEELKKNLAIVRQRQTIKQWIGQLKKANPNARAGLRQRVIAERNRLKKMTIAANVPRLRQFLATVSQPAFDYLHIETDTITDVKQKLGVLMQHQLVLG